uniref:Uncharacterized protein n=1 Tax=Hucho hucho TaxID=62062 RepID=A0A4W5L2R6_9TELE
MVTDSAVYIGNHDWVGSEFAYNAGTGLVIKPTQTLKERGATILEQVKAVFERDWHSRYAKTLQPNMDCPEDAQIWLCGPLYALLYA